MGCSHRTPVPIPTFPIYLIVVSHEGTQLPKQCRPSTDTDTM